VILVDANLLLYAYNASAPEHERAKTWLAARLSDPAPLAMSWWTLSAFLRLSTHRRIYPAPLSIEEANSAVAAWLERPMVVLLEPGPRFWSIARQLLEESNARGPLVADALIAALCLEHGATLATHDTDFRRFPDLSTVDPIVAA
jgi:uncharacterized protein